jgi:hypothetical protein
LAFLVNAGKTSWQKQIPSGMTLKKTSAQDNERQATASVSEGGDGDLT